MDRASWVVAFLGSGTGGLDPDRLRRGLHLLTTAGVIPEDQRYAFERPPAAGELGKDLAALQDGGVVTSRVGPAGVTEVRATLAGSREAAVLLSRLDPRVVGEIRRVRRSVGRLPLERASA
jgi:hypothetical protein